VLQGSDGEPLLPPLSEVERMLLADTVTYALAVRARPAAPNTGPPALGGGVLGPQLTLCTAR
jgi:hypothetical protein